MAKKKLTKAEEQDKIIEALKFVPHSVSITIYGYGGEIAMGRVKPETVEYFRKNFVSVPDYAWDHAEEGDEDYIDVPEDLKPFSQGSWYECDDIDHSNGADLDSIVEIKTESGDVLLECEVCDIEAHGSALESSGSDDVEDHVNREQAVFVGVSSEKGTFFETEFELTAPFDAEKLKIVYHSLAGYDIIRTVEYDGEELDGSYGQSTDGKSSDFMFYYADDEGEIASYVEATDEEMGVPHCGPSPDDWESSAVVKYAKAQPVRTGWYRCVWEGTWSKNYGELYWNGQEFVEFVRGKERSVAGMISWQGYSWDTGKPSDKPTVPPEVKCNNSKCGWAGDSSDRVEDDEYNDHCPDCNGTDVDWLDFNVANKIGRDNRKLYNIKTVKNPADIYPFPGLAQE